MSKKTLRTYYTNDDLEEQLQELALIEHSSVSRIVRMALNQYIKERNFKEAGVYVDSKNTAEATGV